jgi:hypothetical protein
VARGSAALASSAAVTGPPPPAAAVSASFSATGPAGFAGASAATGAGSAGGWPDAGLSLESAISAAGSRVCGVSVARAGRSEPDRGSGRSGRSGRGAGVLASAVASRCSSNGLPGARADGLRRPGAG